MIQTAVQKLPVSSARLLRPSQSGADAIAFCAVWLVSIVTPWCIGGVHDAVFALAGLLGLVAIAAITFKNWSSLEVPRCGPAVATWMVLLPFAVGAFQLIPFPDSVHRNLSPKSIELRERLEMLNESDALAVGSYPAADPVSARPSAVRNCLSVAPASTKRDLSRYWVASAFFLVSIYSLSQSKWLPFYFASLALNGVAIATFSLIQKLSWNGKIYWSLEVPWNSVLGPFVNKNNGAGYLLMVLAVVMTLLYGRISTSRGKSLPSSFRSKLLHLVNDNTLMFVFGALLLLWIAIVLSMSRGALVGGLAATLVTVLFVWRRNWVLAIAIAGVSAALVCGLMVWSEQSQAVKKRVASIVDHSEFQQVRVAHWADDFNTATDFSFFGSGIGTYPYVNRPYQSVYGQGWFLYSENQYLESLIVGGIPGIALLSIFLGVLWYAVVRLTHYGRQNPRIARYATLGMFLVVAQMIAAFFDFGLYHVPNACLMACLAGVVIGKAHSILPRRAAAQRLHRTRWSFRAAMLLTVCLGIWSSFHLGGHALVEWAMNGSARKMEILDAGPHVSRRQLDAEIGRLSMSLMWYPHHPFGLARLANLHIMRFRQELFDELKDGTSKSCDEDLLWNLTALYVARSVVPQQTLQEDRPHPLFDDASYQTHLLPAWNALLDSRDVCPMLPTVHYRLALMSPLVGASSEDTTRHLERAIFLAPREMTLHFNSGMMMVANGERQTGLQWISKAATAQKHMPAHVAAFAKAILTPSELINSVLPADPEFILDVINRNFNEDRYLHWRLVMGERCLELLPEEKDEENSAKVLFQLARSQQFTGQYRLACETYRAAIAREPGMASWRFGYAETLTEVGEYDEALREGRFCERMMPDSWRVQVLLANIQKAARK